MRIAYGIFGYGRGHATRAASVLTELSKNHRVLIIAGGDACEQLSGSYPIFKIPTLGYHYRANAKRSNYLTLRNNAWHVLDIFFRGPTFQSIVKEMQDFKPDVVISDAEPWTHRAARFLGIPRIGFDHFGIMAYCRPQIPVRDWLGSRRDAWVYRILMGQPQRVLVSSFYEAPPRRAGVSCVPPLLRDEVTKLAPRRGEHLLAYFNKGEHQFTPRVEAAVRRVAAPFLVYGTARRGIEGNLDFRPLSNLPFLEDLASCRAVFSTAGNQLVGEALHLGKPMLVMPEDCVEQRVNAAAVERLGIGVQVRHADISAATIDDFLRREGSFADRIRHSARDGRREAVAAIERFLQELAPQAASEPSPATAIS